MNIVTYINHSIQSARAGQPSAKEIANTLREYVAALLMPLKPAIDAEEEQWMDCTILLNIHQRRGVTINLLGYSHSLACRINTVIKGYLQNSLQPGQFNPAWN